MQGYVKEATKTAKEALNLQPDDQIIITAGLTGTGVMMLGYMMAAGMNGIKLTGSGADEDEKRQGHQDYALEFSADRSMVYNPTATDVWVRINHENVKIPAGKLTRLWAN